MTKARRQRAGGRGPSPGPETRLQRTLSDCSAAEAFCLDALTKLEARPDYAGYVDTYVVQIQTQLANALARAGKQRTRTIHLSPAEARQRGVTSVEEAIPDFELKPPFPDFLIEEARRLRTAAAESLGKPLRQDDLDLLAEVYMSLRGFFRFALRGDMFTACAAAVWCAFQIADGWRRLHERAAKHAYGIGASRRAGTAERTRRWVEPLMAAYDRAKGPHRTRVTEALRLFPKGCVNPSHGYARKLLAAALRERERRT